MASTWSDSQTLDGIFRIFELVTLHKPRLLPASRWLVASSHVAAAIFEVARPTSADLVSLAGLLETEAPELVPLCRRLAESQDVPAELVLELQLDALVASEGWRHPAEVLWHPPLRRLLELCKARASHSEGDALHRLSDVRRKLESALRLRRVATVRRTFGPARDRRGPRDPQSQA